ncbi:MAG: RecB-family nuclease [Candidatus Hodarchaeota archaeon]
MPLFVTLHNVFSQTMVRNFTSTALALGCKTVIISRAHGSAAMSGVPEAQKVALKADGSLLFFRDLPDALELLSPKITYLVISDRFASQQLDFTAISNQIREEKIMIVFGGSSPGLTRKELDMGQPVYIRQTSGPLSAVAELAITLDRLDIPIASRESLSSE